MAFKIKDAFLERWSRYFGRAELPIVFFYTDQEIEAETITPPQGHRCVIADIAKARRGRTVRLDATSLGCSGARNYLGFSRERMPDFEYFLSCGIPGRMEGERYKKTPELVRQFLANAPEFEAPARFVVFKRWDTLEPSDEPEAVIFFASADVLAGLFTLANFEEADPFGVIAPFAAGCGTMVEYPYLENRSQRPRAVLGSFDVSARPCLRSDELTFAVPMKRFVRMVENMDESFLIAHDWEKVRRRMDSGKSGRSETTP
ncbi:MAG: DUF169 domain-containing protein [Phycisphaerae bacterium]|nr:DUF169 domain-containing protein [Phycisphaerae bacterium]